MTQVKEIFCFIPNRQENTKDRNSENTSSFPQNAYLLQKKDSSSIFLFERGHLLVRQQPSNESTTSTKRSEDTISIAKTNMWFIFTFCICKTSIARNIVNNLFELLII